MERNTVAATLAVGFAELLVGCGSMTMDRAHDAARGQTLGSPDLAARAVSDAAVHDSAPSSPELGEGGSDAASDLGRTEELAFDAPSEGSSLADTLSEGSSRADATEIDAPAGAPHYEVAVRAVAEPWGRNCPRGGTRIETGFDFDRNGILDYNEVRQEQYVCNAYPTQVSLGPHHTCAMASSGAVWCWGADNLGQLGDSTEQAAYAPRPVEGAPNAQALAVGADFACIILPSTGARCWGKNDRGQVGHGVDQPYFVPACVTVPSDHTSLLGATSISLGGSHACLAVSDGKVFCWGANEARQLGDGTITDRNEAVEAVGLVDATQVAAGGRHTCALLRDSSVRCWGANDEGQLGDGTSLVRSGFVKVGDGSTPLSGVAALVAGEAFTCALMKDATVQCWGANGACQLGQPTTLRRSSLPVAAPLQEVSSMAAGTEHACAALKSGKAVCWGKNDFGQVGAPASACRPDPVELPLARVTSVGAGRTHSCAVEEVGVWCWGDDSVGQLGIGVAGASRSTHLPQPALWRPVP